MLRAPSKGRGRRSPIVAWMLENRSTLEAGFKRAAPAWNVLAEFLCEHGVTDGMGRQPTARTTREAWGRVQSTKPVPPLAPDEPTMAPAVRPVLRQAMSEPAMPKPSVTPDGHDTTPVLTSVPARTFRFATPKGK